MGLCITVDIFSGLNNPSWEIRDPDRTRDCVEFFVRHRAALADIGSGFTGLGFRGVQVHFTDDIGCAGLPPAFELAGGGAQDPYISAELADRLLETMPPEPPPEGAYEAVEAGFSHELREMVRGEIQRIVGKTFGDAQSFAAAKAHQDDELAAEVDEQVMTLGRRTAPCPWDSAPFNPEFWNHPAVQPYNNCYNYGVNYRTDTMAKPGRKHDYEIPATVTGQQVAQGLFKDGLRLFGVDCQPPGGNRVILALVTGAFPNGFRDFHFYRYHAEGHWSHKQAANMARRTDNSGVLITNPYLCDRGIYTEWYGLFQSHNTVLIK
ncbi:hypothetical protein SLUN_01560 [Streptomyces lunaelactis]|uniref:Uncharacterized protein n=1 Tax=Streptomyces lunaelactis TaxID=1535768 RepID=A0A2R4SW79_9ACTN|nr:hypothetical protein [Streptomyces lunaelactis]AVZ71131.1 hypothetical protein SLUN_01560 [Streptomyces lunaelactis]NUK22749.1 hypothetical protein [Streptomyces lunaelactis]NUK85043.1 hypothetical protein [Streptomyces lunaelactis]